MARNEREKNHNFMILEEGENFCKVAVLDENDELLLEKFRFNLNKKIMPVQKTATEIRELLASQKNKFDNNDLDKIHHFENSWESEPIINLVDSLLEDALDNGATDIHLEPSESQLRIRLRQDGLLQDFKVLPSWICDPVLIRLKILAEVDITDKRIPHDGSFTYDGFRHKANIRLSTIPIQSEGNAFEKCVLRLLPLTVTQSSDTPSGLSKLSLSHPEELFLRTVFNSPQGLFLVTGPTGSGKTTTLHAGLQEIARKHINITTIEDPVEYVLDGVNQVQVNEKCGFTFAEALRSILRQDPDVIFVGEIRDEETAQIAIRAAQTGHLVLSTLHTNSAQAAFTRLQDLGIGTNAIKDSLLGIMAQRLVRKKVGPTYKGRRAVTEILRTDGTFVNGNLQDSANRLLARGITDKEELTRVLGQNWAVSP